MSREQLKRGSGFRNTLKRAIQGAEKDGTDLGLWVAANITTRAELVEFLRQTKCNSYELGCLLAGTHLPTPVKLYRVSRVTGIPVDTLIEQLLLKKMKKKGERNGDL